MEVILQYFDGCPNWQVTVGKLSRLIEEGMDVTISTELIDSHETAVARGFRGSPTVLVNGVDPFADTTAPVGLACRIYKTEEGHAGSPSLRQLRDAVAAKR